MHRAKAISILVGVGLAWAHLVAHDIPSREHWDQFRTAEELAAMRPQRGEDPPPAPDGSATPPASLPCGRADLEAVMATIRHHESGGRYHIGHNAGGASGAYQFIQPTWDAVAQRAGRRDLVGVAPYRASEADQDAMARQHIGEAMGAGIENIPVIWYVGHVPSSEQEWNTVPRPDAGNRLTPRQYQQMWLQTFNKTHQKCEATA